MILAYRDEEMADRIKWDNISNLFKNPLLHKLLTVMKHRMVSHEVNKADTWSSGAKVKVNINSSWMLNVPELHNLHVMSRFSTTMSSPSEPAI